MFQRTIPPQWIYQVFESTNKASLRWRNFPAELMVWLIIGMGLYYSRSITDVVSKLDLVLGTQEGKPLAVSAIVQARQRLSDVILREHFTLTVG